MTVSRFLFAAVAGGAIVYWLLFLFVAGGMAGEIYWNGYNDGTFIPGYLISLYAPPIIATFFSLLAFRRLGGNQ